MIDLKSYNGGSSQPKAVLFCALFAQSVFVSCHQSPKPAALRMPPVVLWAWERPEDLRFLNARQAGVAFLAANAVVARNGSVAIRMRTQSLLLPPGVAVLPVIRIESPAVHAPADTVPIVATLDRMAGLPGSRGIQIDFDARRSERGLYRTLLADAASRVSVPISVTALASWCEGDPWLDREPVAEAVPMLFRMGRGEFRDADVNSPVCQSSLGLSADEPWPAVRPARVRRIYLFNPRPWTQADAVRAFDRLEKWK